jgi:hypothetical protein
MLSSGERSWAFHSIKEYGYAAIFPSMVTAYRCPARSTTNTRTIIRRGGSAHGDAFVGGGLGGFKPPLFRRAV